MSDDQRIMRDSAIGQRQSRYSQVLVLYRSSSGEPSSVAAPVYGTAPLHNLLVDERCQYWVRVRNKSRLSYAAVADDYHFRCPIHSSL